MLSKLICGYEQETARTARSGIWQISGHKRQEVSFDLSCCWPVIPIGTEHAAYETKQVDGVVVGYLFGLQIVDIIWVFKSTEPIQNASKCIYVRLLGKGGVVSLLAYFGRFIAWRAALSREPGPDGSHSTC